MHTLKQPFLIAALTAVLLPLHAPAATFTKACEVGGRSDVTIAAVGDIIFHNKLKRATNNYDFIRLWRDAIPMMKNNHVDILYGNYEGAVSYKGNEANRIQKVFKYHPKSLADLKQSGFDVLSTANNHALDAGVDGALTTIKEMRSNRLGYTGTRTPDQNANDVYTWATVQKAQGKEIAFIACTESTNGIRDSKGLVLMCNSKNMLKFVTQLSRAHDAVIVTPHWGSEGSRTLTSRQITMASNWALAGAAAILGSHTHLVGEVRSLPIKDSQGRLLREALVISSLGNIVSNQPANLYGKGTRPDFGVILYFGLTFTRNGATVSDYRFAPTVYDRSVDRLKVHGYNINSSAAVQYLTRHLPSRKILNSINALSSELVCQR